MTDTVALIVSFQAGAMLRACVEAVLAQRPRAPRVVVVDNASDDGSTEGLPGSVTVLRRPANDGFGAAIADGLEATREPFVLMLNPDVTLEADALDRALALLRGDWNTGSVALTVRRGDAPDRLDACGIALTTRLGQLNVGHDLPLAQAPREPIEVLGPLGGAALWRRDTIVRAGGMPRHYFLYWEDVHLALRANRAGYRCLVAPDARAVHGGSATVGRWSPTNVRYMVGNHWRCLVATLPGRVLVRHALALLLAPPRAALLYALRGRPGAALGGLLAGLASIPGALWSRRRLPRSGSGRRCAARVEALLAAGDAERARLKAAARGAAP